MIFIKLIYFDGFPLNHQKDCNLASCFRTTNYDFGEKFKFELSNDDHQQEYKIYISVVRTLTFPPWLKINCSRSYQQPEF